MATYHQKDLSFEAPAEWIDTTVAFFHGPAAPAGTPPASSITVMREPLRAADTLRTHADRKLVQLGKDLARFELLESTDVELAGRPAVLLRFRFGPDGRERIEQTMVLVDPLDDPERVVVVVSTAAVLERVDETRVAFATTLRSLRFDQTPTLRVAPRPPEGPAPSIRPPLSIPMPGFPRR